MTVSRVTGGDALEMGIQEGGKRVLEPSGGQENWTLLRWGPSETVGRPCFQVV